MRGILAKVAFWAVTGLAGLVIAAAQVSVEDATSNLGGWLDRLGVGGLASAVSDPRFDTWATVAAGLVIFAATVLAVLRWRAKRRTNFVPLPEAGLWLYEHGNDGVREALRHGVDQGLWPSLAEAGASFIREATARGSFPVFARWEDGLPLEEMPVGQITKNAFEEVFGPSRRIPFDASIRRSDLKKVRDYYRD